MGGAVKSVFGIQDAATGSTDQALADPFANYRGAYAKQVQGKLDSANAAGNLAAQTGLTNAATQQGNAAAFGTNLSNMAGQFGQDQSALAGAYNTQQQGLASTYATQANANMAGAQGVGSQLQGFLSGGASGVFNDPVYQKLAAQGDEAVSRRFAAGGKGMSGNEMLGLSDQRAGLANNFYNQQLGNLQSSMGALGNLGAISNQALGAGYNAQSGANTAGYGAQSGANQAAYGANVNAASTGYDANANALSGVTNAYQNAAANQQNQFSTVASLGGANAQVGQGQQMQIAQQQANTAATSANNAFGNAIVGGIASGATAAITM
jgi:hypothetical protein